MKKWYEKTWLIILLLIIFFPVGLFLMWRSNWNKIAKISVSIFFAIGCVGAFCGGTTDTSPVVQEKDASKKSTNSIDDSLEGIKKNIEEIKNDEEVKEAFKNTKESLKENIGSIDKNDSKNEPELTEDEYKDLCNEFEYKDIARNPGNYENKNTFIKGKVIQVSEGLFDSVTLRVATKETEYLGYADDIYIVTYKQVENNRILEDDMVTIWGVCNGVTTYKSLAGNVTVPSIEMRYYEINN